MREILDILRGYEVNPTTWVYLSALMTIGIYFKFRRFWSVRNLDLGGLIVFGPGLLLVLRGHASYGYTWLLVVSLLFVVRLLIDTIMVRRPLLEPNLSASGLTFTCAAMLMFLIGNVVTGKVDERNIEGARRAEQLRAREHAPPEQADLAIHGPGFPLFYLLASVAKQAILPDEKNPTETARNETLKATAQTAAILGHLAIVIGMVLIGYRHFDNIHTGVAAATLYLLLPYTAQLTNRVDHVVPAALLVWAVQCYRRPALAGIFVGLAAGVIYYPLFLLPLWCSFYLRRGLIRFGISVTATLLVLVATLALTSSDWSSFCLQLREMFGWTTLMPDNITGFWEFRESAFRIPVMVAFCVLCVAFAFWPAQKNLGTLLSCSALVMLGVQFWHAQDGGIYMAWYLPLLILTIFRPNLEDRVALSTVREIRLGGAKARAAAPVA